MSGRKINYFFSDRCQSEGLPIEEKLLYQNSACAAGSDILLPRTNCVDEKLLVQHKDVVKVE